MAKSRPRPKLVRKSPKQPAPRPVQKPRPVVRRAHRRTRPVTATSQFNAKVNRTLRDVYEGALGEELKTGSVLKEPYADYKPARTIARERALTLAEELGISLDKPKLRRATDRIEKALKSSLAPKSSAPKSATLMGGTSLVETSETLPSDIMGIHPSLRGLHGMVDGEPVQTYAGIERVPLYGVPATRDCRLDAPRPSAPGNVPPSPLAAVIDTIASRGARVWGLTQRLEARLIPVSSVAPPHGVATSGANAHTAPPHAIAALEQIGDNLAGLGDFIETITDRLLV